METARIWVLGFFQLYIDFTFFIHVAIIDTRYLQINVFYLCLNFFFFFLVGRAHKFVNGYLFNN